MALDDLLDFDQLDPDQVEKEIQAGGLIPPGLYHVALAEAKEKPDVGSGLTELTFQILSGQFKGRKVKRDLFHQGKDAEKDKITKNELVHFATVLGCVTKTTDAEGKKKYQRVREFEHAVGEECVVEVVNELYDRKDPAKGTRAAVKMFGAHGLTDKKGQDCLAKLGLVVAGATTPAAGGGGGGSNGTTPGNGTNGHSSGNAAPAAPPAQQPAKKRFNLDSL